MYERLQDAVLFFELQQDRLLGPEAERQLVRGGARAKLTATMRSQHPFPQTQIDQYISEIMELKKNGQVERDQLKKELTSCRKLRRVWTESSERYSVHPRDCHGTQKTTH